MLVPDWLGGALPDLLAVYGLLTGLLGTFLVTLPAPGTFDQRSRLVRFLSVLVCKEEPSLGDSPTLLRTRDELRG